jgi:hypothetical protein
LEAPKNMRN